MRSLIRQKRRLAFLISKNLNLLFFEDLSFLKSTSFSLKNPLFVRNNHSFIYFSSFVEELFGIRPHFAKISNLTKTGLLEDSYLLQTKITKFNYQYFFLLFIYLNLKEVNFMLKENKGSYFFFLDFSFKNFKYKLYSSLYNFLDLSSNIFYIMEKNNFYLNILFFEAIGFFKLAKLINEK